MSDLTEKIKELSKCKENNVENQHSLQLSIFKLFNRLNKLVDQSDLNDNGFAVTGQYEVESYWNNFSQEEASDANEIKDIIEQKESKIETSAFSFEQLRFSKEANDTLESFVKRLKEYIQFTEDTKEWCRASDSRKMLTIAEHSMKNLISYKGIDEDVHLAW